MRGTDHQQSSMFSYISAEQRVPKDHPLQAIRVMVDAALEQLRAQLDAMYAKGGRPSIPPEKLLRAAVAAALYRSQRAAVDGATRLQPLVPLVRGAEHG
jgi:transposase